MEISAGLRLLRRRWFAILACLIAGVAGALTVTATTPRSYGATARLFVNIPVAGGVQEALQGAQLSSQLLQSYAQLATSRAAAERASARLGGRFTASEVQARVSARPQPETLLVDVSAVDQSPEAARDIANAAAEALISLVADFEPIEGKGISARVIDVATASDRAIDPKPRTNLALGILLGLGAGAALALALESLDSSIASAQQASAAFGGAPVLTSIPRHRRLGREPLIAMEGSTSAGGESYRALRTCLRYLDPDGGLRTVLVTSAVAEEGKSTTVANLAVAIAQSGERVVVIDADLRRSRVASLFDAGDGPGLTEVLQGSTTLEQVLRPWRDGLLVLPPGAPPSNPSELLGSQAMADLLQALTAQADVVVLDAPPILAVTDATVLSALVDGVVVVARWGSTEAEEAEEARYILDGVGANVVGVVLNQVRSGRSRTYYRSYGTAPPAAAAPRRSEPVA